MSVANAPVKHKHHDCIVAWATGAEIEALPRNCLWWRTVTKPSWFLDCEYRIKPEPKPDCRVPLRLIRIEGGGFALSHMSPDNFVATFDGETGELKAVELL